VKCPRCGLENPTNALRCDCGFKFALKDESNSDTVLTEDMFSPVDRHPTTQNNQFADNTARNKSISLPIKWLRFYTYFLLPLKIIMSPAPVLLEYSKLIEQGYTPEFNFMQFVPIIILDIFIIIVIYGIYKRRYWSWICNWILLVLIVVFSPLNYTEPLVYLGTVTGFALFFFLPNYFYFRKRRILFS